MNETKKGPVRIRESYMNITGNYPIWEWERRCRPRDGGGGCGRKCKYLYNNLSRRNRSPERLIWDKRGQKQAWGKNPFIFQAAQWPDGIQPRGSRVPAIRGCQRLSPQPRPGPGSPLPEAPGREREEAHGGPDRRCASYHLPWPETERSKSTPAAARKAPGWQTDQESGPAPPGARRRIPR